MFSKIGRYLYAIAFVVFGIIHFLSGSQMAGYVPGWIPGGAFWIYLTGAGMLAAGVSIIIEKKTRLACILLGVMLLIFILTIHVPAVIGGDMPTNLLKDLALTGGAWYIAGHYESDTDFEV